MTTWVLLRGLMRESRHWGDFTQQFSKSLDAQAVITLDFPGNGSLYMQKSLTNITQMVENVREQLMHREFKPPYCVVALSLGAMVAEAWSERHPDELSKMVLINTSLAPYNPFYQRLRPKNYPAFIPFLYSTIHQRESLILKLTSERSSTEDLSSTLQKWEGYAKEYPISRMNILRQLLAAARYSASHKPPRTPALLLTGAHDQLVNPKCTLTLAMHWGCQVQSHPSAGHDLPLDDSSWVIQKIKAWLANSY
jgi:pimeloyl-ACP methyl ester carboxylesterase